MKEDFVNPKKPQNPRRIGQKPMSLSKLLPSPGLTFPNCSKGARFIDLKGPIHHWKPVGCTHCLPKF